MEYKYMSQYKKGQFHNVFDVFVMYYFIYCIFSIYYNVSYIYIYM